ncbi:sensor histidine kinase [Myroides pelagicus]|uniref:Histidine kinase n=1 Tax=Myroides pelagicus TaxID=270914 RepID=A0A7K1GJW8_9FLAO|nr:histidine kinase [Myroides pelagicus]MEC4113733.1 histidine kinase [Myroides pelagicus]MTH28809.1 histidine kinase [Myroides pelagicus]
MIINWNRHLVLSTGISILTSMAISYYYFQNSGLSFLELWGDTRFLKNYSVSFLLCVLIYWINVATSSFAALMMNKREVNKGVSMPKVMREIVFFINGIITSLVSYYLLLAILLYMFYEVSFEDFFKGSHMNFGNFIAIVLLSVFILLIVFVFAYYDEMRLLMLKNKEMEIALQKSQIESMKEQLSPHFLFNNLNVLISTIQEDPVKAELFARSFSKIYRYVLEKMDNAFCSLEDELSFIKDYVYLLNVRYDNAIDFEIEEEVQQYVGAIVPTLSLQVLIENVVKHNSIPSDGKINVRLKIMYGKVELWNEKRTKPKQEYSSGLGLQNLSKRCLLLYGEDIVVENFEDSFSVRIPLNINE